ncbi:MAG: CvpA family protein [Gammaproteobacteria bacterium]
MGIIDYAILALLVLSALVSIWRGLIREVLSLVVWVAALWVSLKYTELLVGPLSGVIELPSMRVLASGVILFVAILLCGVLVSFLVGKLIAGTGLSGTDRMLGVLFGTARGVVIVGVLLLLAGLTPFPQDPWWQESALIPHFIPLAEWMRGLLPGDFGAQIAF